MEPDAVQRENKPLECRLILFGALSLCVMTRTAAYQSAAQSASLELELPGLTATGEMLGSV